MEKKAIALNAQEATLRQLLLDVSIYIGSLGGFAKPQLRFTGGWVRDKLRGSTSPDIDIGIDNMTGHRFGTLMRDYLALSETKDKYDQGILGGLAKIEANPEKSKHLETVTTRILGLDIDLVNLRKETYVEDSRNPTMEFGTPKEDALRRDATINALFYNLSTLEVEDFTGRGLDDMERRVIKTPLAPLQTFQDDPLRILRSIRFASRLEYQIAPEDEIAMRDPSIKGALRLKISRERVGVEVMKMIKGPNPYTALDLIDRLTLYNAVFTNPIDKNCNMVNATRWRRAYGQLAEITKTKGEASNHTASLRIKSVLLRSSNEISLAWMLVCFVPWAREDLKLPQRMTAKKVPSAASLAAREGIKADNKIVKVVDDAVSYLQEIVALKDAVNEYKRSATLTLKRKNAISREIQGKAIRRWGSSWRSSIIFSLLTQVMETETETEINDIVSGYSAWLDDLELLDLLDVDQLKPIINGNQICKALGMKPGPWMKKALDIAMEWQLRNPFETDPVRGIEEVMERKKEIGIT